MFQPYAKIIDICFFPILCFIILISFNCNSPGANVVPVGPVWQVFTTSNSGLHNNHINNITIAYNQRIWFSTMDGGAYFDHGSWGLIRDSLQDGGNPDNPIPYLPSYGVHDIVDAKDHAVWFCLNDRVARFAQFSQAHVWTSYKYPFVQPLTMLAGAANRSAETPYGDIWIAGIDGISLFHQGANETGNWSSYEKSDGSTPLPSEDVLVAEYKPDDYTIWFGTKSGGAVEAFYNESGYLRWQEFTPVRDPGNSIYSIGFADLVAGSLTSVWFGRDTDVVVYNISSGSWSTYSSGTTGGKMPRFRVNAIATNYGRQRWFGTNRGLVKFENDNSWMVWTMANSTLPNDTITALRFDFFQNLWIGTPEGVAVYNPGGIRSQ